MMLCDKLKQKVNQQFSSCDKFVVPCDKFVVLRDKFVLSHDKSVLSHDMTFTSRWKIHCTMIVNQVDVAMAAISVSQPVKYCDMLLHF